MASYDVIIIGSGAGGGTLVHHLAPSGKRILLLERGDWLPREPQNWIAAGRVRREPLRLAGHLVRRATASRSSRRSTTSSVAPRSSTAQRSIACAPRTSASCGTTTASRRPGRSATTSWSPTTRRRSSSTRCMARAARTRPSLRPARRTRSPRSRTSRGSSSSRTTSPRPATIPFHAPCGIMLDEDNMPTAAASAAPDCDGFPCLVHAKSDAEVLAVRPALEHPNVTLMTNAKAVRLDTNAAGTAVTEVVVEHDGETESVHRGHRGRLVRRRQLGQAALSCRRTTSIPTGSPTAPTRSVATTCSTTARRCSRSRGGEPDGLPEDARAQRLLLRQRRLRVPARATSRWSASRRPRCSAARSPSRRSWRPSGRWSESPATRSTSGSRPRTCRGPRTGSSVDREGKLTLSYTRDERGCEEAALRQAQVDARPPRHALRPLFTKHAYMKNEIPVAGLRASGRHLPLRHATPPARCSTPTAGRTSSTTSTWSTPASFPASARSTRR